MLYWSKKRNTPNLLEALCLSISPCLRPNLGPCESEKKSFRKCTHCEFTRQIVIFTIQTNQRFCCTYVVPGIKNGDSDFSKAPCLLVGMTGFEPATPRPPGVCATGLRHIPNYKIAQVLYIIQIFGK